MNKDIGRNDPCPCGSGKKYKKCCMPKEDTANLGNFRYEKKLAVRSSAVDKMLKLAAGKIGITHIEVLMFLTDSPLFEERNIDPFSGTEEDTFIFQYLLNSLLIYAYPADSSGEQLWKYCLEKYSSRFSGEEVLFLQSLKDYTAGFFQVKEIDAGKYLIIAEDIFTSKTYKVMDRGISSTIKRNDIFAGLLIPYDKDSYLLEGGAPIVFPPIQKDYIRDIADLLFVYSRSKLRGEINEKLSRFLNKYPVSIYRIVLDYYYITLEAPPPKIMTTDNEEIVFSKSFYEVPDMQDIKKRLLKVKGFKDAGETGQETVISWHNKKNTILGTAYLGSHELRFETNSNERLEKWKSIIKNMPVKFIKTESTDLQSMMEEMPDRQDFEDKDPGKAGMDDIPEEAIRDFALDWWKKYYDEWPDTEIPFLGNKTPREAIKTDMGKQKVIDIIDDYENKNAHREQGSLDIDIQKYFDADELRKRMGFKP